MSKSTGTPSIEAAAEVMLIRLSRSAREEKGPSYTMGEGFGGGGVVVLSVDVLKRDFGVDGKASVRYWDELCLVPFIK